MTRLGDIRDILNRHNGDVVVELCNLADSGNLHVEESALHAKARLNIAHDVGIYERVAREDRLGIRATQGAWVGNLGAETLGDDSIVVDGA